MHIRTGHTTNGDTYLPHRLIVKLGTSVLTAGTDHLNRPFLLDLARQMALLRERGVQVVLVSSGAIAAGWERLNFPAHGSDNEDGSLTFKQVLAAVGQSRLMHLYEQVFDMYDLHVAQVLLTRSDLNDRRRYFNARHTLLHCLERGIVPIINENDALATDEIRVGDNDTLSALVAGLVDADLLLILTDMPGLFSGDPRNNPDAHLIHTVEHIDDRVYEMAGGSGTHRGTGGMRTKIQAADLATHSGTTVVVASGHEPDVVLRGAVGERLGTRFPATISSLDSRKRWLLSEIVYHSRVVIDAATVSALREDTQSLFPANILSVQGPFERGQTIRIFAMDGEEIARGQTRYAAADLETIKGMMSWHIADVLGYSYGSEVVHHDDMVTLIPSVLCAPLQERA